MVYWSWFLEKEDFLISHGIMVGKELERIPISCLDRTQYNKSENLDLASALTNVLAL